MPSDPCGRSPRLTGLGDLDDVLQEVVDQACRLLAADGAVLSLMVDGGALKPSVIAGQPDAETRAWLRAIRHDLARERLAELGGLQRDALGEMRALVYALRPASAEVRVTVDDDGIGFEPSAVPGGQPASSAGGFDIGRRAGGGTRMELRVPKSEGASGEPSVVESDAAASPLS